MEWNLLKSTVPLSWIFQDAVEECLRGVLGNDAAEALYKHLKETKGLPQQDLFARVQEFTAVIDFTFGKVGQTIERTIAERFYWKLGLVFIEQPKTTLQNYVDNAILEKATKLARVKPIGEDEMRKVTEFVKNMKPTDHAILFYSEPEMKRQLLFDYLKEGLKNGEAAAYIASQETPDQIKEAMRNVGFDVEQLENAGALHIYPYTQWYYLDGYTDRERTNALWQQLYDKTKAKGFRGLRVTGETSCFFERGDERTRTLRTIASQEC